MTLLETMFVTFAISLFILLCVSPKNYFVLRTIAFCTSLILFVQSLLLLSKYDPLGSTFIELNEILVLKEFNLYFAYGVDGTALCFVILTTFIFLLCFTINTDSIKNLKGFIVCLLFIEAFSILSFVSLDLLFFYVFFESLLIPMFIFIGI